MFSTYNLKDFGQTLKEIRVWCGLTQSEVSRQAGVHEDAIRKIEHGTVIPKHETLQYLSDIYKIDLIELLVEYKNDKDLIAFTDRINKIITNNKSHELKTIIDDFEILISSNHKLQLINPNDINKFKLYLLSVEEFFKNTADSYFNAKNYLTEALSNSEKNFCYLQPDNYKFNYFEISMLLLLGISIFHLNETEASTKIMEFCLTKLKDLKSMSTTKIHLILKLMYNLAYNYHIQDDHLIALQISNEAIQIAVSNDILFSLPQLFYRKGIAEFSLGISDYENSIRKSILLLDIYNNQELKNQFIKITEELYNIKLE